MSAQQREECFRTACRLVKDVGTSAYNHFGFTLRLAQWLYGPEPEPAASPPPDTGETP